VDGNGRVYGEKLISSVDVQWKGKKRYGKCKRCMKLIQETYPITSGVVKHLKKQRA